MGSAAWASTPPERVKTKPIAASPTQVRVNRLELLGRLADDLAHEIKNPLHSMIINLELLKRRVTDGRAEEALERADVVGHELRRVHSLIEALLQLLRPAEDVEPEVDFAAALDGILPVIRLLGRLAGVQVDCDTPDFQAIVRIRPDALQHAVLNLVVNALDALPPVNGRIELRTCLTPEEVQLRIRDNGPGIPAAVLDRIGTPGFTTRPGRSGLGIAVTCALIEPAGGRIEVDDPGWPDAGATFLLAMPYSADGLTLPGADG